MKKRGLLSILAIALIPHLCLAVFKVSPYSITDNQNMFLAFEPKQDSLLIIDIQDKTGIKKITKLFKKDQIAKVNLGIRQCDNPIDYKITKKNSRSEIHRSSIPPYSCKVHDQVSFLFVSDTHNNHEKQRKMAGFILKKLPQNTSFVLHGGDWTHHGGYKREWYGIFDSFKSIFSKLPIIGIIGNHDYKKDKLIESIPENYHHFLGTSPTQDNFGNKMYGFPQFNIIAFNSNLREMDNESRNINITWLKRALKKSREQNKKVIFSMHHTPYSSSVDAIRENSRHARKMIIPHLESSGNVIMVLTGHLHMYERSYKNGIHYITTSCITGKRNVYSRHNKYGNFLNTLACTFSIITAGNNWSKILTYDDKGQMVERYSFLY